MEIEIRLQKHLEVLNKIEEFHTKRNDKTVENSSLFGVFKELCDEFKVHNTTFLESQEEIAKSFDYIEKKPLWKILSNEDTKLNDKYLNEICDYQIVLWRATKNFFKKINVSIEKYTRESSSYGEGFFLCFKKHIDI